MEVPVGLADDVGLLLRAVVPAAVLCVERPGEPESREAAERAVREAAAWFLPGVDVSVLGGHELNHHALSGILQHDVPGHASFSRHRMEAALSAMTLLSEALHIAHSRSMHSWGWSRPKVMSRVEAVGRLRGAVTELVGYATYAVEGDAKAMWRGTRGMGGLELDLDALLPVVAEALTPAP